MSSLNKVTKKVKNSNQYGNYKENVDSSKIESFFYRTVNYEVPTSTSI